MPSSRASCRVAPTPVDLDDAMRVVAEAEVTRPASAAVREERPGWDAAAELPQLPRHQSASSGLGRMAAMETVETAATAATAASASLKLPVEPHLSRRSSVGAGGGDGDGDGNGGQQAGGGECVAASGDSEGKAVVDGSYDSGRRRRPSRGRRQILKSQIWVVSSTGRAFTRQERMWRVAAIWFVLASTFSVTCETVMMDSKGFRKYRGARDVVTKAMEVLAFVVFSVELGLRTWACTEAMGFPRDHPTQGRIKFLLQWSTLFDVSCLLPFATFCLSGGALDLFGFTTVAAGVRVYRVLRIFKLLRFFPGVTVLTTVLKQRSGELKISAIVSALIVVALAAVVYTAERKANPTSFPNMVTSLYWSVIHLSSVGYGACRRSCCPGVCFHDRCSPGCCRVPAPAP